MLADPRLAASIVEQVALVTGALGVGMTECAVRQSLAEATHAPVLPRAAAEIATRAALLILDATGTGFGDEEPALGAGSLTTVRVGARHLPALAHAGFVGAGLAITLPIERARLSSVELLAPTQDLTSTRG